MVSPETLDAIRAFVAERDWAQFHSPENLAKSISVEAAELLECYQWSPDADIANVRDELADVLIYALILADKLDVDVDEIIAAKIEKNRAKYPVAAARDKITKYDQL